MRTFYQIISKYLYQQSTPICIVVCQVTALQTMRNATTLRQKKSKKYTKTPPERGVGALE